MLPTAQRPDHLAKLTVADLQGALEDLQASMDVLLSRIPSTSTLPANQDLVVEAAGMISSMDNIVSELSARGRTRVVSAVSFA